MPASGWGSLWESPSFVPRFVLNAFRDITGVVPDLPWSSGFMRKSSFTWVKWVGNVSLYRNYPQNIRSIRMYSVLYPEWKFWWVFQNGSGMVPETFHNTFLGCSSKFFLFFAANFRLFPVAIFKGKYWWAVNIQLSLCWRKINLRFLQFPILQRRELTILDNIISTPK